MNGKRKPEALPEDGCFVLSRRAMRRRRWPILLLHHNLVVCILPGPHGTLHFHHTGPGAPFPSWISRNWCSKQCLSKDEIGASCRGSGPSPTCHGPTGVPYSSHADPSTRYLILSDENFIPCRLLYNTIVGAPLPGRAHTADGCIYNASAQVPYKSLLRILFFPQPPRLCLIASCIFFVASEILPIQDHFARDSSSHQAR
jgi:hypothetical protein